MDLLEEGAVEDLRGLIRILPVPESLEVRIIINTAGFHLSHAAKSIMGITELEPLVIILEATPTQVFGDQAHYRELTVEKVLVTKEFQLFFQQFNLGDLPKDAFFKTLVLKYVAQVLERRSGFNPDSATRAGRFKRANFYTSVALAQKSRAFRVVSQYSD